MHEHDIPTEKAVSQQMDFWITDEDIAALEVPLQKKAKVGADDDDRSNQMLLWADLKDKNMKLRKDQPACLEGTIVQLKATKKAKRLKMYLKQGSEVGFCLLANNTHMHHDFKIGMLVRVVVDRIVGIEFDKSISSLLCTHPIGIIARSVHAAPDKPCDDWKPINFQYLGGLAKASTFTECLELSRATSVLLQTQVKVRQGAVYSYHGKKLQQWLRVEDQIGVSACLILNDDQGGLYGVSEEDRLMISGFSIVLSNGKFRIFLGPNGALEIIPNDHEDLLQVVPKSTRESITIESVVDKITQMDDAVEAIYEFKAQISGIDLPRSLFGKCSSCGAWQRIVGTCSKCHASTEFESIKIDAWLSVADESGQWSRLRLKDPTARRCLGVVSYSPESLSQKNQEIILSWAKLTVSVLKMSERLQTEIINLSIINPFA